VALAGGVAARGRDDDDQPLSLQGLGRKGAVLQVREPRPAGIDRGAGSARCSWCGCRGGSEIGDVRGDHGRGADGEHEEHQPPPAGGAPWSGLGLATGEGIECTVNESAEALSGTGAGG
jgi:hypothetical protein